MPGARFGEHPAFFDDIFLLFFWQSHELVIKLKSSIFTLKRVD